MNHTKRERGESRAEEPTPSERFSGVRGRRLILFTARPQGVRGRPKHLCRSHVGTRSLIQSGLTLSSLTRFHGDEVSVRK